MQLLIAEMNNIPEIYNTLLSNVFLSKVMQRRISNNIFATLKTSKRAFFSANLKAFLENFNSWHLY